MLEGDGVTSSHCISAAGRRSPAALRLPPSGSSPALDSALAEGPVRLSKAVPPDMGTGSGSAAGKKEAGTRSSSRLSNVQDCRWAGAFRCRSERDGNDGIDRRRPGLIGSRVHRHRQIMQGRLTAELSADGCSCGLSVVVERGRKATRECRLSRGCR